MKKLTLILILLVWLTGCNNNWKLIGNSEIKGNLGNSKKVENIWQKNYTGNKQSKLVSGSIVGSWEIQKKKEVKPKKNSKKIKLSKPEVKFSIKILPKYWELYGNIISWHVDRIDIASINENTDLDNIDYYTLKTFKSGDKKFIYRISPKFDNIPRSNQFNIPYSSKYNLAFLVNYFYSWDYLWQDEISYDEFISMFWWSFEEQLNKLYKNNMSDKLKSIAKILETEGCNLTNKIPTEKWKEIYLTCNGDDSNLIYNWNNKYYLLINEFSSPIYEVDIENWKITNEWYSICWNRFKTFDEFYNLTWEVAIWNLDSDKCKFVKIWKYNWYYANGYFITIENINKLIVNSDYMKTMAIAFTNDRKNNYWPIKISWDSIILKNIFWKKDIIKAKIKYFDTKYGKNFILYYSWDILKITHADWFDGRRTSIYKTFLNWKEVK